MLPGPLPYHAARRNMASNRVLRRGMNDRRVARAWCASAGRGVGGEICDHKFVIARRNRPTVPLGERSAKVRVSIMLFEIRFGLISSTR